MAQVHSIHNPFTAEEIETCLYALVAWAGNSTRASAALKEKGLEVHPQTLNSWKRVHGMRLDEIREKHRDEMESRLGHEFRDAAAKALEAQQLAVEAARLSLENGTERDPARAAANLARVAQSNIDKLMTVTARPTSITETRNPEELIRSLARLGVIQIPPESSAEPEPAELE